MWRESTPHWLVLKGNCHGSGGGGGVGGGGGASVVWCCSGGCLGFLSFSLLPLFHNYFLCRSSAAQLLSGLLCA